MKEWREISSQHDIDELLDAYAGFHDSCIVSMSYRSGAFVDEERAMHFGGSTDRQLLVTFHSQWEQRELEMCFVGLRQLHLTGWQDNYLCNFTDAYLSFKDGLLPGTPSRVIIWADRDDFDVNKIDNGVHEPSDTYIVANALKWRMAENKS